MADAGIAQQRVEKYLLEVRTRLRGLPDAQASEIVEELRSHIRERAMEPGESGETGVAEALERLGRPGDLAAMYLAENIVARAEERFSPWLISKGVFRWAALSSAGTFVLLGSLAGYALAAIVTFCALRKPFAPDRVGLWRTDPDSFSLMLGFGDPPPGVELLGWWIVPLGLLAGIGLFLLTAQFGLWSLRRLRQTSTARRRPGSVGED